MVSFYISEFRNSYSENESILKTLRDEDISFILFSIIENKNLNEWLSSDSKNKECFRIINDGLIEYFENLAEVYFIDGQIHDELINKCFEINYSLFTNHLIFLKELKSAITNHERSLLKSVLSKKEQEIQNKEIEIAVRNVVRKDLKEKLASLELLNLDTKKTSLNKNITSTTIKFAAFILILFIPASLLIYINSTKNEDVRYGNPKDDIHDSDSLLINQETINNRLLLFEEIQKEQWDFCDCVRKNDSITKVIDKMGDNDDYESVLDRMEEIDEHCKELLTVPNSNQDERQSHSQKVKECLE